MKKIKARNLGFVHIGQRVQVGDNHEGLSGPLDRLDISVFPNCIDIYVYNNEFECGLDSMTLDIEDALLVSLTTRPRAPKL